MDHETTIAKRLMAVLQRYKIDRMRAEEEADATCAIAAKLDFCKAITIICAHAPK